MNQRGLITPAAIFSDVDYYRFSVTNTSVLNLDVRSAVSLSSYRSSGANLAMNVQLSRHFSTWSQNISLSPGNNQYDIQKVLNPGNYFMKISADTPVELTQPGFSDYGNGGEYLIDFNLKAVSPPQIMSPTSNATIGSSQVRLEVSIGDTPVDAIRVLAGPSPRSSAWFFGQTLTVRPSTNRSRPVVRNLPTDGRQIHISVAYRYTHSDRNDWRYIDLPLVAANL